MVSIIMIVTGKVRELMVLLTMEVVVVMMVVVVTWKNAAPRVVGP